MTPRSPAGARGGGGRLARLLLRRLAPPHRRDEIEHDLAELFEHRRAERGRVYAARRYWSDVLSLWRSSPPASRGAHPIPTRGSGARGASAIWFDTRQALRSMRRMPAFFVLASLTLAVGFAAHFAAFTIVDRLLLASPPGVADPGALRRVHIERADIRGGRFLWFQNPYSVYQALRRSLPPSVRLGAYRTSRTSLGAGADARQVTVAFADGTYFGVLGASAALGRVLLPGDDPAPSGTQVLVLSDTFWRAAFGADPGVLGRDVRLGAKAFTVVGIMPRGFAGDSPEAIDAWAPLHAGAYEMPAVWTTNPVYRSLTVVMRLPAEMSSADAAERTRAAYQRTIEGTAEADPTVRVVLAPIAASRTQSGALTDSARIALWLQGVAALVLLVAVANVVNLQLSRALQRRREMAVRVALGAGRARLVTQLGAEAAIVVGGGALGGVVLARLAAAAISQLLAPGSAAAIDTGRFAAFVLVSSTVAIALCTAAASASVGGERIADRLRSGRGGDGFTRPTFRQAILIAQVAISAMLLVGAGLFVRSMDRLGRLEFGMDQDRVLTIMLPLRNAGYSPAAIESFFTRAIAELRTVPGVEHVSAGQTVPFRPSLSGLIALPGTDQLPVSDRTYPTYYSVTPDHFATVGTRILRGRPFLDSDTAASPP